MSSSTDWAAWSREAVALMQRRNEAWIQRFGLRGEPFDWDLERGTLSFARGNHAVVADLCVVGTASTCEGTFLWAWANGTMPEEARRQLDTVREFGEEHDLGLLTTPEWEGGRAEGLEMLAVAGRILDAEGFLVDTHADLTLFFLLFNLRRDAAMP